MRIILLFIAIFPLLILSFQRSYDESLENVESTIGSTDKVSKKITENRVAITPMIQSLPIIRLWMDSLLYSLDHKRGEILVRKSGMPNTTAFSETVNSNFPVRLSIPKIHLNIALEQVGLTSDWRLDVPRDPATAGWYKLGPYPGDIGSAVIDGHSGYINGKPTIFNNLSKLQIGDTLSVEDRKWTVVAFVVREFHTYGQYDIVSDIFFSHDWKSHLNIITCQGIWSKLKNSYPDRLVIFADKIE